MTKADAVAEISKVFPDAYHYGHGTINVIKSHSNYQRRKQGRAEEPERILSNNMVISSVFDDETIEQLDTALWVQAAAIVKILPFYDLTKYLY